MQTRKDFKRVIGGDVVQIEETARALHNLGHKIDISSSTSKSLKKYDIIHLFNFPDWQLLEAQFQNAKRQNKAIIFSSIYWDKSAYLAQTSPNKAIKFFRTSVGIQNTQKIIKKLLVIHPYFRTLKYILENADFIIPNAKQEAQKLQEDFAVPSFKIRVVLNGANIHWPKPSDNSLLAKIKFKKYILSVARIERRKNQLNLIQAVRSLGVPLVLAGQIADRNYYLKCLEQIKNQEVHWIPSFSRNQLPALYKDASVHILPSWYESCGLSSLEAAYFGCSIVSTKIGGAKDYFNNLVYYCDPASIDSIRGALKKALFHKKSAKKLIQHIQKCSWQKAAKETEKVYWEVLDR